MNTNITKIRDLENNKRLSEKINSLNEELSTLKLDYESMKENSEKHSSIEFENLKNQINNLINNNDKLKIENEIVKSEKLNLDKAFEILINQHKQEVINLNLQHQTEIEKKSTSFNTELLNQLQINNDYDNTIKSKNELIDMLEQKLAKIEKNAQDSEKELKELQLQYISCEKKGFEDYFHLNQKYESLKNEYEKINTNQRNEVNNLTSQNIELLKKLEVLQSEKVKLRTELENLKEENNLQDNIFNQKFTHIEKQNKEMQELQIHHQNELYNKVKEITHLQNNLNERGKEKNEVENIKNKNAYLEKENKDLSHKNNLVLMKYEGINSEKRHLLDRLLKVENELKFEVNEKSDLKAYCDSIINERDNLKEQNIEKEIKIKQLQCNNLEETTRGKEVLDQNLILKYDNQILKELFENKDFELIKTINSFENKKLLLNHNIKEINSNIYEENPIKNGNSLSRISSSSTINSFQDQNSNSGRSNPLNYLKLANCDQGSYNKIINNGSNKEVYKKHNINIAYKWSSVDSKLNSKTAQFLRDQSQESLIREKLNQDLDILVPDMLSSGHQIAKENYSYIIPIEKQTIGKVYTQSNSKHSESNVSISSNETNNAVVNLPLNRIPKGLGGILPSEDEPEEIEWNQLTRIGLGINIAVKDNISQVKNLNIVTPINHQIMNINNGVSHFGLNKELQDVNYSSLKNQGDIFLHSQIYANSTMINNTNNGIHSNNNKWTSSKSQEELYTSLRPTINNYKEIDSKILGLNLKEKDDYIRQLNNVSLKELDSEKFNTELNQNDELDTLHSSELRIEELKRRNSLCLPHMRSNYALEELRHGGLADSKFSAPNNNKQNSKFFIGSKENFLRKESFLNNHEKDKQSPKKRNHLATKTSPTYKISKAMNQNENKELQGMYQKYPEFTKFDQNQPEFSSRHGYDQENYPPDLYNTRYHVGESQAKQQPITYSETRNWEKQQQQYGREINRRNGNFNKPAYRASILPLASLDEELVDNKSIESDDSKEFNFNKRGKSKPTEQKPVGFHIENTPKKMLKIFLDKTKNIGSNKKSGDNKKKKPLAENN